MWLFDSDLQASFCFYFCFFETGSLCYVAWAVLQAPINEPLKAALIGCHGILTKYLHSALSVIVTDQHSQGELTQNLYFQRELLSWEGGRKEKVPVSSSAKTHFKGERDWRDLFGG